MTAEKVIFTIVEFIVGMKLPQYVAAVKPLPIN